MTLLEKYKSDTQTLRNGEAMPYWDAFLQWKKAVHEYFQTVRDYNGYPVLPDFWLDGLAIYDAASEVEKRFIANTSMTLFIEALRHWKVDADQAYPSSEKTFLPLE